jgi:hypothetical protein
VSLRGRHFLALFILAPIAVIGVMVLTITVSTAFVLLWLVTLPAYVWYIAAGLKCPGCGETVAIGRSGFQIYWPRRECPHCGRPTT